MKYQSSSTSTHFSNVIKKVKVFSKSRPYSKVKVTSKKKSWFPWKGCNKKNQKFWYPLKGLATSNNHVKYQSSSFHCSKVISKIKVSDRFTKCQNGGMIHRRKKTRCPLIFDLGGIKLISISIDSIQGHTISLNLINTTIYRL